MRHALRAVLLSAALVCGVTGTAHAGPANADPSAGAQTTTFSYATAINDDGVIVGDGPRGAVRWEIDGTVTELGRLSAFDQPSAFNINNAGVAVGFLLPEEHPVIHAARWDANGTIADLDAADEHQLDYSVAFDVNAAGDAVGWRNFNVPVRWRPDGESAVLPLLPGEVGGWAGGINDAGSIVGAVQDAAGRHRAVSWAPGGGVTALPAVPGQSEAYAIEISDSGAITGDATVSGRLHAVRWTPGGSVTLLAHLPGYVESSVTDVNDDGVVVGGALPSGGLTRAVRWGPNGEITELPLPSGTTRSEANGINDDGVIVGAVEVNGETRAVRWNLDGTVTFLSTPPAAAEVTGSTAAPTLNRTSPCRPLTPRALRGICLRDGNASRP